MVQARSFVTPSPTPEQTPSRAAIRGDGACAPADRSAPDGFARRRPGAAAPASEAKATDAPADAGKPTTT
jgi:hypothetical protein